MGYRIATYNYCKLLAGASALPSGVTNGNQCPRRQDIESYYNGILIINNLNQYASNLLVKEIDLVKIGNMNLLFGTPRDRMYIKTMFFVIVDSISSESFQYLRYTPFTHQGAFSDNINPIEVNETVNVAYNTPTRGLLSTYRIFNATLNLGQGEVIDTIYNYYLRIESNGYNYKNKYMVAACYTGWFGLMPGVLTKSEISTLINNYNQNTLGDVYSAPCLLTLGTYDSLGENDNPCKFGTQAKLGNLFFSDMNTVYNSSSTIGEDNLFELLINESNDTVTTTNLTNSISSYSKLHLKGYGTTKHLTATAWKSLRCNNMYYTRVSWHGVNIRYDDVEQGIHILNSINYDEMLVAGNGALHNNNDIVEEKFLRSMPSYISDIHIRITYGDVKYVNGKAILSGDRHTIETFVNIAESNGTYSIGSSYASNNTTVKAYDQDQRQFFVGVTESDKRSYIAHTSQYITIYKIEVLYNYKPDEVDTTINTYTHSSEAYDSNPAHKVVEVGVGNLNTSTTVTYFDDTNSNGEGCKMPENLDLLFLMGFTIGLPLFECEHNIINTTGMHIKFRLRNSGNAENVKFYLFGNQITGNININVDSAMKTPSYCHMEINKTGNPTNGVPIVETPYDIGNDYRMCLRCGTQSTNYTINGLESTKELTLGGNTIGYILILQQRDNNNKVHTTSGSYGGTHFWNYLKTLKGSNRIIYIDCMRISN